MSIKGVLFDKDGTLIQFDATWVPVYRHMFMEMFDTDLAGAEEIMATVGYDRETGRMKAGTVIAGGTTRELAMTLWPDLDEAGIRDKVRAIDNDYTHVVAQSLAPLMPLEPILTELRGMGLRLGIATNDTHGSATAHMTHIGIIEHFEDIIGADTVPVPKPSGNMIQRFAEITGLKPSEIAMVGDNHHDMEEARNGGAGLAVGVLSGNAAHEDIAHLADHVIDSVADLPRLLRSL